MHFIAGVNLCAFKITLRATPACMLIPEILVNRSKEFFLTTLVFPVLEKLHPNRAGLLALRSDF
jgi:hypothetical protein